MLPACLARVQVALRRITTSTCCCRTLPTWLSRAAACNLRRRRGGIDEHVVLPDFSGMTVKGGCVQTASRRVSRLVCGIAGLCRHGGQGLRPLKLPQCCSICLFYPRVRVAITALPLQHCNGRGASLSKFRWEKSFEHHQRHAFWQIQLSLNFFA